MGHRVCTRGVVGQLGIEMIPLWPSRSPAFTSGTTRGTAGSTRRAQPQLFEGESPLQGDLEELLAHQAGSTHYGDVVKLRHAACSECTAQQRESAAARPY